MARTLSAALAASVLLILPAGGRAQPSEAARASLPPECRVPDAVTRPAALPGLAQALATQRIVKLLTLGPSSAAGVGSSSAFAGYPPRLEKLLEKHFKGVDFDVIRRGLSREVAEDQIERVKLEVADVLPDLVVWQVGARDAMARVNLDEFVADLTGAMNWFRENHIDVVLVEPPFSEARAGDAYYLEVVKAIAAAAEHEHAPLIRRFEAMHALAKQEAEQTGDAVDPMHLVEKGYHCLANYVTDVIVKGVELARSKAP